MSSSSMILKANSNVNINGNNYTGRSIVIKNGNIFIDGDSVKEQYDGDIKIIITGDADRIETSSGDVEVYGSCKTVGTMSGDVTVAGSVYGNVKTMSGDVSAGSIGGDVETMSGKISKNFH